VRSQILLDENHRRDPQDDSASQAGGNAILNERRGTVPSRPLFHGPSGFIVGRDRFTAATQEIPVAAAPSHPPSGRVRSIASIVSVALDPMTSSRLLRSAGRIRTTELPDGPFSSATVSGSSARRFGDGPSGIGSQARGIPKRKPSSSPSSW
jgi:hypothetical protein